MTVSSLLAFALALFVVAASPGPSIAALVARVLTSGCRDVLPFLAAMWLGEALWLSAAAVGLAAIAHLFRIVLFALKMGGVAYLLFLACKMWFAPTEASKERIPMGRSPCRMFGAGIAVTLGNLKIMIFYLALLPSMLDLGHVRPLAWLELTITMLLVLISVDLAWVVLAVRARLFLTNRRAVKIANRSSAVVMVGAAAAIAAQ